MFKKRFGYSLLLLAILAGTILASIPPVAIKAPSVTDLFSPLKSM